MTDRPTRNEPSQGGSKMVTKDNTSPNLLGERKKQRSTRFEEIESVGTKDNPEARDSSVSDEEDDGKPTDTKEPENDDNNNKGRVIFENIENDVEEESKIKNKRLTLSFCEKATIIPSPNNSGATIKHLRNCYFHRVLWEIRPMGMASIVNQFRYTRNSGFLNLNQRLFYEKNGYLVFPKLISKDILDKCHKRFDEVIAGKVERNNITVMKDVKDRKSVNKIQDINHDKVFREYIENKNLLDIVECFTGPHIMAVHSMLIAKPPDIGYGTTKHPPHQDLYYFPFRPANSIVAAWTAMETCTRENGCLYVAPRTHALNQLYPHDYPPDATPDSVNKFYHGILDLPKSITWHDLEMEPGDTVFFHPLLIHGSGVNRSTGTRRAISCHYASADCHYIDVENTAAKRIQDEVMGYVQKRYPGADIKYTDVWSLKSTLVRGIRSSL